MPKPSEKRYKQYFYYFCMLVATMDAVNGQGTCNIDNYKACVGNNLKDKVTFLKNLCDIKTEDLTNDDREYIFDCPQLTLGMKMTDNVRYVLDGQEASVFRGNDDKSFCKPTTILFSAKFLMKSYPVNNGNIEIIQAILRHEQTHIARHNKQLVSSILTSFHDSMTQNQINRFIPLFRDLKTSTQEFMKNVDIKTINSRAVHTELKSIMSYISKNDNLLQIINELDNSCAILLELAKEGHEDAINIKPFVNSVMRGVHLVIHETYQTLFEILQPKHGFNGIEAMKKWLKETHGQPCKREGRNAR